MEKSNQLKKFKIWEAERRDALQIPCRNRYGNIAHFQDYDGVVMIGFGDEEGVEPDKDALHFDKEELPKVIAFLQKALERERPEQSQGGS